MKSSYFLKRKLKKISTKDLIRMSKSRKLYFLLDADSIYSIKPICTDHIRMVNVLEYNNHEIQKMIQAELDKR